MSAPAPSMFTPEAIAMAEKLGLKKGRANLEEFAATLTELAKEDPNIVAVTSDSRGSAKLVPFSQELPNQIVEVGIAEQNLVVPADNFETREAIRTAAQAEKPFFVRFGKAAMYGLHQPDAAFEVGKAITVREGTDIAMIATGETVIHALLAAGELEAEGISCRVLSMHSIKPLDHEAILRAGNECGAVVTVEEHFVNGGLGEACASVLMQGSVAKPFRIVGIPDEETVTGAQADIFRHYGISMEGLTNTALSLLDRT